MKIKFYAGYVFCLCLILLACANTQPSVQTLPLLQNTKDNVLSCVHENILNLGYIPETQASDYSYLVAKKRIPDDRTLWGQAVIYDYLSFTVSNTSIHVVAETKNEVQAGYDPILGQMRQPGMLNIPLSDSVSVDKQSVLTNCLKSPN